MHANPMPSDQFFSDFYRAEVDAQVRRAALLIGSSEAANDVVHDAFVQIYRRWQDIEQPGPYLNRAVLNGCRDFGRRARRDQRLMPRLFEREHEAATPEPLAAALKGLSFNHRAAVVLRFYGGFTTAEIATALACAPGSVGPWIDRAVKQLRKELQA
jgi:RNA polymerase sigma factor (sigma-70 family)